MKSEAHRREKLAVLDAPGCIPNGQQPEPAVVAPRWLYAGVPCFCNMFAVAIAYRYPVTRQMHAALRRTINEGVDLYRRESHD